LRGASHCRAEVVSEENARRSEGSGSGALVTTVQNDTAELDSRAQATFEDLRFPQGTRLKPVRLHFSVQLQFAQSAGTVGVVSADSEPSHPFVVLTNENQWDVAAGSLLQRDAFGASDSCPWYHFANTLQIHYLKATRQDCAHPQRPLSVSDLQYIHAIKFGKKPVILLREFERFWEWFGKVLHKIRHQRHLSSLWLKGLIYGFIPREAAEQLLRGLEAGTFLLRFSERIAGQFAVAYVKLGNNNVREVKHYLVKPEDIAGPNKTLADFLRVHEIFMFLVEKKTGFLTEGGIIKGTYPKNQILEEFYSKKNFTSIDGYEEEVD